MTKFEYGCGGYFGGYYNCVLEKDKIKVTWGNWSEKSDKCKYYDIPHDFDKKIKTIINEWKNDYPNPGILDGTQWGVKAVFDDDCKIESHGDNAYPDNFDDLYNYMETFISELRNEIEEEHRRKRESF